MNCTEIVIRSFRREDQAKARHLVLAGLGDHFGTIDETMNPDLDDIAANYLDRGGHFVVAECGGRIVGTGGLIAESDGIGRLVRMSVDRGLRGRGLGRSLADHLLVLAQARGDRRIVVETNHDWWDAIGLYRACGFVEQGVWDGDRHFALDL